MFFTVNNSILQILTWFKTELFRSKFFLNKVAKCVWMFFFFNIENYLGLVRTKFLISWIHRVYKNSEFPINCKLTLWDILTIYLGIFLLFYYTIVIRGFRITRAFLPTNILWQIGHHLNIILNWSNRNNYLRYLNR